MRTIRENLQRYWADLQRNITKTDRLWLPLGLGFIVLWMVPLALIRLREPGFGFFETLEQSVALMAPAVLMVVAFWRWQRDAYKHVITRWRWRVLVLGLYANALALAVFWLGNVIFSVYEPQWSLRLGEILVWWRNAETGISLVAFVCSVFGDGDGRYALALGSLWFLFLWLHLSAPVFL